MQSGAGELDGSGEGVSVFAVPCGKAAELFETVEAAFDAIAKPVQDGVVRARLTSVEAGRDDRFGSHTLNMIEDGLAVIATISDHDFGVPLFQQREGLGIVAALPGRDPEGQRLTQAVNQQVNLGRQTASASPQSLVAPFLRPVAACW